MTSRYEDFSPTVERAGGWTKLTVSGRKPIPPGTKLNPLWWIGNDWDVVPPSWFYPEKSARWRAFMWWWRNPFENFKRWVCGVGDLNYTVRLIGDSWWTTGNVTNRNWEVGLIDGFLPWLSYSGDKFEFYIGWQPVGVAAIKCARWGLLLTPLMLLYPLMIVWRVVYGVLPGVRRDPAVSG